jgi:carnitine O-octanoyltransferase
LCHDKFDDIILLIKHFQNSEKVRLFKAAADSQFRLMNEAKQGKGYDRHLFAMWCIAYDNDMPIPELYNDPLYSKSGGGGNFELSTSTLGYFINIGYVAPMIRDGFGIFYTMLEEKVWIVISSYRESEVTSSKKFYDSFASAMNEIREMLEKVQKNKL